MFTQWNNIRELSGKSGSPYASQLDHLDFVNKSYYIFTKKKNKK